MEDDKTLRSTRDGMGEIDLYELARNLWKEKWVIAASVSLCTAIALVYAFLANPVYRAEATVMPPRQSDIAAFNVGRLSVAAAQRSQGSSAPVQLNDYTAEQVYGVFLRNLLSSSLFISFFEDNYLPYLGFDAESEGAAARDGLLRRFSQILSVRQPDSARRPDYYEISVELESPQVAAEWANHYVELAADRAKEEMLGNVTSEIASRRRVAEIRIDGLRTLAQQQRADRIARLKEALGIANALGIESPQITVGRSFADSELAAFVEGDLMYMRGTRALQAELDVMENRENDDPFVAELRTLENQVVMLQGISIDSDAVSVFTLDGVAEIPQTPIKPRKTQITLIGIIVGGLFGMIAALLRISVRSRRER